MEKKMDLFTSRLSDSRGYRIPSPSTPKATMRRQRAPTLMLLRFRLPSFQFLNPIANSNWKNWMHLPKVRVDVFQRQFGFESFRQKDAEHGIELKNELKSEWSLNNLQSTDTMVNYRKILLSHTIMLRSLYGWDRNWRLLILCARYLLLEVSTTDAWSIKYQTNEIKRSIKKPKALGR